MAASSLRRVALVTGAAQGLGRSIALRLAKDGLDVAVNDIQAKREQLEELACDIKAKEGRQTAVVPADVASERDVRNMTESVVKHLGGLDVVCLRQVYSSNHDLTLSKSPHRWLRMLPSSSIRTFLTVNTVSTVTVVIRTKWCSASPDEFDRVMSINARGVMLSYKYAALQMIRQGRGGRIIGISYLPARYPYTQIHLGASSFVGKQGQRY